MGWEAVIWSPSVETMRHWTTLLIVAALTACSDKRPVDCEVLRDETFACMDRVAGSGERNSSAIFDECFPMSEPQRFTGTWATDFEVNEFHEGQALTAEEAWRHQDATDRLWGTALERHASDNSAYVMEVEFVGRYPLCNLTQPGRDIIVDDLIRARTVERTPSKM